MTENIVDEIVECYNHINDAIKMASDRVITIANTTKCEFEDSKPFAYTDINSKNVDSSPKKFDVELRLGIKCVNNKWNIYVIGKNPSGSFGCTKILSETPRVTRALSMHRLLPFIKAYEKFVESKEDVVKLREGSSKAMEFLMLYKIS